MDMDSSTNAVGEEHSQLEVAADSCKIDFTEIVPNPGGYLLLLLLQQPFNGLYRTTWVSRYQKGKSSPDFNETRDNGLWYAVASAAHNLHLALAKVQSCIIRPS